MELGRLLWNLRNGLRVASSLCSDLLCVQCFFNVKLPHYKNYEVLRTKLTVAIRHCQSITS